MNDDAATQNPEDEGDAAFARLKQAFPNHAETIGSLMWMGSSEGEDHFKHRFTRKKLRFNPLTGQISGRIETGEESDDGDEIMREVATI